MIFEHPNGIVQSRVNKARISIDGGTYYIATTITGQHQRFGFYSNACRWLSKQGETKVAAPKGNKFNQKGDDPATSFLHARVTPRQKAGWVRAAQRENMKLTEWVIRELDRAQST